MTELETQEVIDQEHLRLLSIGYMVSAAFSAITSLFGLFYAFLGVAMSSFIAQIPSQPGAAPPPEFMGWFFGLFGLAMFTILMLSAILKFVAARRLKQRRSRVFCMVVAGLTCLGIPWGTLLGIFTFMVLGRPSVGKMFEREFANGQ